MPNYVLLTGAGFSRNWGGWLADEAFEYLLGHPRMDDGLRSLLWKHKEEGGGFEAAFDEQLTETAKQGNTAMLDHAQRLEQAIHGMFADMDKAFAELQGFNAVTGVATSVTGFLTKFDAIFTLNQDLLMERQYLTENLSVLLYPKRIGWQIPGMERSSFAPFPTVGALGLPMLEPMEPSKFAVDVQYQPYFKLHGSINWVDPRATWPMLVIGGNKPKAIERYEILKWNHKQFRAYLSKPDTRLMIIGYSFRDEHINDHLKETAERGNVRLFIIDPSGVNVLKNATKQYWELHRALKLFDYLQPLLIGASRRRLRETFEGDMAEQKVMRFFD